MDGCMDGTLRAAVFSNRQRSAIAALNKPPPKQQHLPARAPCGNTMLIRPPNCERELGLTSALTGAVTRPATSATDEEILAGRTQNCASCANAAATSAKSAAKRRAAILLVVLVLIFDQLSY
jgi:hypothetical protein